MHQGHLAIERASPAHHSTRQAFATWFHSNIYNGSVLISRSIAGIEYTY